MPPTRPQAALVEMHGKRRDHGIKYWLDKAEGDA